MDRGERERERDGEIKKEIVGGGGRLMEDGSKGEKERRQPYDEPVAG